MISFGLSTDWIVTVDCFMLWLILSSRCSSVCSVVCLSVCRMKRVHKNAFFSETTPFRAMVFVDDQ